MPNDFPDFRITRPPAPVAPQTYQYRPQDLSGVQRAMTFNPKPKKSKSSSTPNTKKKKQAGSEMPFKDFRIGFANQLQKLNDADRSIMKSQIEMYDVELGSEQPEYLAAQSRLDRRNREAVISVGIRETKDVTRFKGYLQSNKAGSLLNQEEFFGSGGDVNNLGTMNQWADHQEEAFTMQLGEGDYRSDFDYNPNVFTMGDATKELDFIHKAAQSSITEKASAYTKAGMHDNILGIFKRSDKSGDNLEQLQEAYGQAYGRIVNAATNQKIDYSDPLVSGMMQAYLQTTDNLTTAYNDDNAEDYFDGSKIGKGFWRDFTEWAGAEILADNQKRVNIKRSASEDFDESKEFNSRGAGINSQIETFTKAGLAYEGRTMDLGNDTYGANIFEGFNDNDGLLGVFDQIDSLYTGEGSDLESFSKYFDVSEFVGSDSYFNIFREVDLGDGKKGYRLNKITNEDGEEEDPFYAASKKIVDEMENDPILKQQDPTSVAYIERQKEYNRKINGLSQLEERVKDSRTNYTTEGKDFTGYEIDQQTAADVVNEVGKDVKGQTTDEAFQNMPVKIGAGWIEGASIKGGRIIGTEGGIKYMPGPGATNFGQVRVYTKEMQESGLSQDLNTGYVFKSDGEPYMTFVTPNGVPTVASFKGKMDGGVLNVQKPYEEAFRYRQLQLDPSNPQNVYTSPNIPMTTFVFEFDSPEARLAAFEGVKAAKLQQYNYTQDEMKSIYNEVDNDYNKKYSGTYGVLDGLGMSGKTKQSAFAKRDEVTEYMRERGLPQSSINNVLKRNFKDKNSTQSKSEVFEDISREILYNQDKSTDPQKAADRRRSNYNYVPIVEGGEIKNQQAIDNLTFSEVQVRGKDGTMRTSYQVRALGSTGGTLNKLSKAPGGKAVHQMNYDLNLKRGRRNNYFSPEQSQEKAPVNFLKPR